MTLHQVSTALVAYPLLAMILLAASPWRSERITAHTPRGDMCSERAGTKPCVITTATTTMSFISSFSSVAYFTFATHEIGVQVSLIQYFTFTNPNLDTNFSINRHRKYIGIINIHTESMQRYTALFNFFGTGNLCTAQTAACADLDAFGAGAHRTG